MITLKFICYYSTGNYDFNKQLNCLPDSICKIRLHLNYDQEIKVLPLNIKKIICHDEYKYIEKLEINTLNDLRIYCYQYY